MGRFPVVAIGSSAGGLEALQLFFRGLPSDSGAAFIIVSHLDPTHESCLADLIGRCTQMPVRQIAGEVPVASNHVYVIAPDQELTISDGVVKPSPPSAPRGHRHPVDSIFRSLAEDQGEGAVAIIMSGTGKNGSLGLRFIKAEGGIVIVQDPATARYGGMPQSAVNTGLADLTLAPEKMGEALVEIFSHSYIKAPEKIVEEGAPEDQFFQLLALLRAESGKDFSAYRKKTLVRRIYRRMGLHRTENLGDYLDRLKNDSEELVALVGDLTINVTGFFRDPEAWNELHEKVVGPLVRERSVDSPVRVWVPGCSTGEEAYSLAMLITEEAEKQRKKIDLRIFATDVAGAVLAPARAGAYPSSIEQDVGPERLNRFFDMQDDTYCVKRAVRETITFAPQNLLQDPPFSRMDIVACRNLLIYLEPQTQKQVLALFHFALKPDGILFLGSAESAGGREELFQTLSKRWRIYRRVGQTRHDIVDFPLIGDRRHSQHGREDRIPKLAGERSGPGEMADRAILDRFAPASVLINDRFRILYFRGPTGDYLQPPHGEPSNNLLSMAREGLPTALRTVVRKALDDRTETSVDARVRRGDGFDPIRIVVSPLRQVDNERRLLVSFVDRPAPSLSGDTEATRDTDDGSDLLQTELNGVREELRLTIEQMDNSNEELKASNEEIRSINEELQASNEELETSKEELQSLNEELKTVNNQLEAKLVELEERTADLNNLLNSTDIATLFLDRSLAIRWFTPGMKGLLALQNTDIGRPAGHFVQRFKDGDMLGQAREVLDTLRPIETEVLSEDGRWFQRRILPYRTGLDHIEGVVLTFVDITELKRSEAALRASEEKYRQLFNSIDQGFCIIEVAYDDAGRAIDYTFLEINASFERQTGLENALGRSMRSLAPEHEEHWFEIYGRIALTGKPENFEAPADQLGHYYEVYAFKVGAENERKVGILFKDIRERKRAEEELKLLTHELSHRVKNTLAVVQSLATQTNGEVDSVEEYRKKFLGRLHSLGQAHGLLIESQWRGAELGQLVRRALEPHRGAAQSVEIEGGTVFLSSRQALGVSLVLHELATNAAKYGSLSVPAGRLQVSWDVGPAQSAAKVHIVWQETGGPPVETPKRAGFGTKLLTRALSYEIGANTKLDFRPEGLVCEIAFMLETETR